MSRRISYYGSGVFNPLNIRGLQLYLNKSNATPAKWTDQSPNAFDFENLIATAQPSIGANSVDYDGVDDFQVEVVANAYVSDNIGSVFISGFFDTTSPAGYYLTSSDVSSFVKYINFGTLSTGEVFIQVNTGLGGGHNLVKTTNTVANGVYFYAEITTNGSTWDIYLNGVNETLIDVVGTNVGTWFNDVSGRDNLVLSSLRRSTNNMFGKTAMNKIIYTNVSVTPLERLNISGFMSLFSN